MDIKLAKPITLPSGLTLPNRLLNAAMTEQMAGPRTNYLPSEAMNRSYAAWAEGGWGMVVTGNVEVDSRYLGGPDDTAMIDDEAKMLEAWTKWAKAGKGPDGSTPFVVQVNHPGRQSPVGAGTKGFFEKNLAPSAIAMRLGDGFLAKLTSALVFGTPRAMTAAECEDVVARFARTARIAAKAGFDGIEIHAAHGYLLAQFLSARSNTRTDAYGGTPVKRAKIVVDIIKAVRDATPAGFTVGMKFNSVDHQTDAAMSDCIEQLQVITDAGIDFLEVSGGTYEDPTVSSSLRVPNERTSHKAFQRTPIF
jgi:2,4-dienoyl-CoA reductase-like NADH-dependent reductase (Old Yellow Enzyme family)